MDEEANQAKVLVRVAVTGDEISLMTDIFATVEAFKQQLKDTENAALVDPNLQLVFGGRILTDRMQLSDYGIRDGCCLLAISTHVRHRQPHLHVNRVDGTERAYGFDRLVESGFSQEEVAQFRTQFFSSSPSAQLLLGASESATTRSCLKWSMTVIIHIYIPVLIAH